MHWLPVVLYSGGKHAIPFSGTALCSHSDTVVFSHSSKLKTVLFTSAYLYLLCRYLFSLHFCLPVPAVPVPFLSSLLPTCTCCTGTFSLFTSAYLYLLYRYLFSLHFCLPVPAVPVPFLSSLLPTCTCCTSTISLSAADIFIGEYSGKGRGRGNKGW